MSTRKPEHRLPRGQRGLRLTSVDTGQALTAEQRHKLWAAYVADRGNLQLRNRLVGHYLPAVGDLAASLAKRMRLRDRENAVGEVLAALVDSIVPGYDGTSGFHRWAYACTKRKLLNLRRAERKDDAVFGETPSGPSRQAELDKAPDRGHCSGDLTFNKIMAELSDRQAVVLWLRGYCGLSVEAVAPLLELSPRSVRAWTRSAVAALREKYPCQTASEAVSGVINL